MCLLFSVGLASRVFAGDRVGRAGAIVLGVSGIGLIGAGGFTESSLTLHGIFAGVFFTAVPISFLLLGIAMLRKKQNPLGALAIAASIIGFSFPLLPHGKSVAIPELMVFVPRWVWLSLAGIRIMKKQL